MLKKTKTDVLQKFRLTNYFLVFLLVFSHSFAQANNKYCTSIFVANEFDVSEVQELLPGEFYGNLKSSFKHNTEYSVVVSDVLDIKNQCSLGTCHLHSWTSELESEYLAEHKWPLHLSTRYLSAKHWLKNSLAAVDDPSLEVIPPLGATPDVSREAILEYGLIPQGVWKPASDFEVNPVTGRVKEFVANIIARMRLDNALEENPQIIEKRKSEAKREIQKIFKNLIGDFPETFEFEGKTYTPQEFALQNFPQLHRPIIELRIGGENGNKLFRTQENGHLILSTNIDLISDSIQSLLRKGRPVYLGYESNHTFMDSKTGIMSISAFHRPANSHPLDLNDRKDFKTLGGGHAVQIVGYDVDPLTGETTKWKIKNSWGTNSGDQGYYHMYDDYFRLFVKRIIFYADEETLNSLRADIGFPTFKSH